MSARRKFYRRNGRGVPKARLPGRRVAAWVIGGWRSVPVHDVQTGERIDLARMRYREGVLYCAGEPVGELQSLTIGGQRFL